MSPRPVTDFLFLRGLCPKSTGRLFQWPEGHCSLRLGDDSSEALFQRCERVLLAHRLGASGVYNSRDDV
jgi:hypothetical protein